jgi:hypothetical protein
MDNMLVRLTTFLFNKAVQPLAKLAGVLANDSRRSICDFFS